MSLGFRVFIVPEAGKFFFLYIFNKINIATIVITGGGMWKDYKEMTPDQALAFEGTLFFLLIFY